MQIPHLLAAAAIVLASACTSQKGGTPGQESASPPFQFEVSQVREVVVGQFSPGTGVRWSAQLRRSGTEAASWIISDPPSDHPILDRLADGDWVNHLLDS